MAGDDDKMTNGYDDADDIRDDENDWGDEIEQDVGRHEREIKRKLARKMGRYYSKYQYKYGNIVTPQNIPDFMEHYGKPLSKMTWDEYKKKVERSAEKSQSGFAAHLSSFLAVNAGVFVINLLTSFGYPWFLFVLGGWGIGLICNLAANYTLQKRRKDVEKFPELSKEAMTAYHRLHGNWAGFFNHLAAYVGTIGFLVMTNMITSPGFPWSLIVAAGWGVGLISHFSVFNSKRKTLAKKFKELLGRAGSVFTGGSKRKEDTGDPLYAEALGLKESIVSEIDSYGKTGSPLDSDLKPALESYMNRIKDLSGRYREISGLISSIPMGDLESDLLKLRQKADSATSPYMKQEYEKSIKEIEGHKHSFEELTNQKEILGLRLKSSMNHLKQLKIDLARMKGIVTGSDEASVSLVKDKTKELSQYLDDLREGYKELEEDSGR